MKPTATIKRSLRRLIVSLYRSEFCSVLGLNVVFSKAFIPGWIAAIVFVLLCGFAGWLEGGAL